MLTSDGRRCQRCTHTGTWAKWPPLGVWGGHEEMAVQGWVEMTYFRLCFNVSFGQQVQIYHNFTDHLYRIYIHVTAISTISLYYTFLHVCIWKKTQCHYRSYLAIQLLLWWRELVFPWLCLFAFGGKFTVIHVQLMHGRKQHSWVF